MSDAMDEDDEFHLVTDKDFTKYSFSRSEFPWKRLHGSRSIRLLKLFSATTCRSTSLEEETIECRLEDWSLHEAGGKYEALSYAWGEPGNGFAYIQCNNVTTKIWRNLYQALLRLRDKISGGSARRTRLIWVDALCIDQTNMIERQEQILLMKSIFGSASQVLIWVGEHDKASRQMWKSVEGVQPGSSKELFRNLIQWNVKLHEGFIRRAWFRRVWTLQEVVLSSKATLLCGNDEMDWTIFCTIWKDRYQFMKNLKPEIRESRVDHIEESLDFIGLMNCFGIHQSRLTNSDSAPNVIPLSEIIIRTWYRDATEAHDRIYALLGLVNIRDYTGLETPDYSQTPLALFVDVIKTAMRVDGMPALLNIAGLSPEDTISRATFSGTSRSVRNALQDSSQMDLVPPIHRPSWVPDWNKHGWENKWLTARLASDDSNARMQPDSGSTVYNPRSWTPVFEDNKLIIRGHIVGHLTSSNLRGSSTSSALTSSTFTVTGLSWGSTGALSWTSGSLAEGRTYTIPQSHLPYHGETAREGDVVCALEGVRSLFLVRMMFSFDFNTWGALEWLKEDISYEGLNLNCLLIGPIQIDGVELSENPSLTNGYWSFFIN